MQNTLYFPKQDVIWYIAGTGKIMSDLTSIKDRIVETMLPDVAAQGWSWEAAQRAAHKAGFQDTMCKAVFPDGLNDIVAHFSDLIDRRMMDALAKIQAPAKIRDKIRAAILTRFDLLESEESRKVMKSTLSYWTVPFRVLQGQRVLWRSSDRIWQWAGDTATDYNRYTKRGLLSSILMGTTLVWLDDKSEDRSVTEAFLTRRIENVMEIGKAIGTIRTSIPDIIKKPRTMRT